MFRDIFHLDTYSLGSVKWAFVVDLPEKSPFRRPFLTAAGASANQRLLVEHDPVSLNIPVWYSDSHPLLL